MSPRTLAERVFKAAIAASDGQALVRNVVRIDDGAIVIGDRRFERSSIDRLLVVGAGKAGASMVAGVEESLAGSGLAIEGQVNVPEDCLRPTQCVKLVGARPAGRNEPTAIGVEATSQILKLVSQCGPRDLVLVLISGGGSALLPAPVEGLTLESKRTAVAQLAAAGADIHALNTVRRKLSRVKGGGLLAACNSRAVETLVISDVVGDDLATIASGPTFLASDAPDAALGVIREFLPDESTWPVGVFDALMRPTTLSNATTSNAAEVKPTSHITIIGSNDVATHAAEDEARRLGCDVINLGGGHSGEAADVGRNWAQRLVEERAKPRDSTRPLCIIDGGEPVVTLAETDLPRKGGRNQELVLAAIDELGGDEWERITLLSGGTDGEDGPTDAAGAVADARVVANMRAAGLSAEPYLAVNNSYPFFEAVDGLIKTGPTHTNVMDVRIGVVASRPMRATVELAEEELDLGVELQEAEIPTITVA